VYRSANDKEKAYDTLFEFEQRNRSIIEARQLATGSQFLSASSEKDLTQSRLLETERSLQQRQRLLLIVLLLFISVIILLIFAYRSNLEKRKALQRLDVLNQDKNRFMGIVSHDLRSPLNSIMMLSDMMTGKYRNMSTEEIEEYSALILHSSKRMEYLIHNMLDASRIESGDTKLSLQPTDIKETAEFVYHSVHILGDEKDITTTLDLQEGTPKVLAEHNAVVRILENLLTNAYKYSDEGSEVQLKVQHINDHVEIIVTDQGPGISEEDQKQLFKKYGKLTASPTLGEKSTGLGLYIVKNLVQEMGGEIVVESVLGKGTTFRVVFNTM
jgi:signal transduction histidine kinase